MKNYQAYVKHLEELSADIIAGAIPLNSTQITQALDGQPSARLRELVSLEDRRASGAFFTSSKLREQALAQLGPTINDQSIIFDSSVGVGDLLVAAAMHMPIGDDLEQTLRLWGRQLRGVDTEEEFVKASKARLLLLAIRRCGHQKSRIVPPIDTLFPFIRQGNGLEALDDLAVASHLALNPSYGKMEMPDGAAWSIGKVSIASVFLEQSITKAAEGTEIVAILPDVLRTGTRYEKWRQIIEQHLINATIEVVGKFDNWTDVDVFILHGVVSSSILSNTIRWWNSDELSADQSLGDFFSVAVGPVVPHRDPIVGEAASYITTATISGKTTFDADFADTRQYSGTIFMPPFVALRRTSRPGQRGRAVGTIITGTRRVAVENHLIVLRPHVASIESCLDLLKVLNDRRTTEWLDHRIRCRHLTVSSVQELPWWRSAIM